MRRTVTYFLFCVLVLASTLAGCKTRPPKVPGETDIVVKEVQILPFKEGEELALEHGELFERLGQRPESLIAPGRRYSQFREAEDRRRIAAYWHQRGYLDVEVEAPAVTMDEDGAAHLEFRVKENGRYAVGDVHIEHAPQGEDLTDLLVAKSKSDAIDFEVFRATRVAMQERLRLHGFGHANVYSRFYVDKGAKLVHVYYFVDAGPKTKIASVRVQGNVKTPTDAIIRRSGLEVGAPYTEDLRDRVVRDLLDTGAYAAAFVRVDTDTKFVPPGTAPDDGGLLRDEQVDFEGNLIPRKLPEGVNLVIHVVEAPSQTVRLRAGFEIDPTRADTTLSGTVWLRNLLGPMQHVVLEGRAGYGYIFDRAADEPPGFYGEGLIRTVHPGALGRTGDLRTTIRYVGTLYPNTFLHRGTTGIGARATFLKGLFLDVDLLGFFELTTKDLGAGLPDDVRSHLAIPTRDLAAGPELDASFIWDARNDPVEPTAGGYVGILSRINPLSVGDGAAEHPFVNVGADLRGFIPLTKALSIGLRGYGEFSLINEGDGIPLGERLFGGGNYGFRGFGAQRLSPTVLRCFQDFCNEVPVGGRSLVEATAEVRFLPIQKQYGANVFADLGGASSDLNPFAAGPSLAAGIGARLRIWYLPAAIDVAYRILHEGEIQDLDTNPFHVFFRIGEAF